MRWDRGGHGDGYPAERRAIAHVVGGNDAYRMRRAVGQPGDGIGSPVGDGSGRDIRGDVPVASSLLPLDSVAGDGRTPSKAGALQETFKVPPLADAARFCDGPETAGVLTLRRWFWDTRPWTAPELSGAADSSGNAQEPHHRSRFIMKPSDNHDERRVAVAAIWRAVTWSMLP